MKKLLQKMREIILPFVFMSEMEPREQSFSFNPEPEQMRFPLHTHILFITAFTEVYLFFHERHTSVPG
jgi:hypothetical protein